MKKLTSFLAILLLLPPLSFAQNKIAASAIIASINRGEAVAYKNAQIEGDLDMTKLNNKKLKKTEAADNESKFYISTVTAPISFSNCIFNGKVLGYYNLDANKINFSATSNEVYTTNFEKDVHFENCTFADEVNFKYSEFAGKTSFAESQFQKEGSFKYTQFAQGPNFSKVLFTQSVVFKYVRFPQNTSFNQAAFQGEADFKYAKFPSGVNFQKATFNSFANFKYADLSGPVNLQDIAFKGSEDFKYTKLNGQAANLAARSR